MLWTLRYFLVLITLLSFAQCRPKHHIREDDTMKVHQFFCHKLKGCRHDGKRVCGFDEMIPHLAVFDDLCTLYKANCKQIGYYQKIDMIVCETRMEYDRQHPNETFEYIHIITTTSPNTDNVPPNSELSYAERFAAFYCYKHKTCKGTGHRVCGFYPKQNITALFPDVCTFYGVNCFKQGAYILLQRGEMCTPDIIFGDLMVDGFNVPAGAYHTFIPNMTTTTTTQSTWNPFVAPRLKRDKKHDKKHTNNYSLISNIKTLFNSFLDIFRDPPSG